MNPYNFHEIKRGEGDEIKTLATIVVIPLAQGIFRNNKNLNLRASWFCLTGQKERTILSFELNFSLAVLSIPLKIEGQSCPYRSKYVRCLLQIFITAKSRIIFQRREGYDWIQVTIKGLSEAFRVWPEKPWYSA